MSKTAKLEDFIKTYVENKRISSSPQSYSDWLKSYGVDSSRILNEAFSDIETDYERAKSIYGTNAERLSAIGLTSSGYSDYLSGNAYATMQKRKTGAFKQYSENEEKNRSGFLDYVEGVIKEHENALKAENDRFYKTVNGIMNAGIRDAKEAYNFAIEAGLSEEKAVAAAKTASEIGHRRLAEDTLSYIIGHGFNKTQAREYALAVGLSEKEAEDIAKYADSINSNPYYTKDYLEYLKYKENNYK